MLPADLTITVLGSGTSVGVPTIGCDCAVCHSNDPRDHRLRPSVLISFDGHQVLVDTTPDFRYQALRAGIPRIDAVLNYLQRQVIPIFAQEQHLRVIQQVFPYIFDSGPTESSRPRLDPRTFTPGTPIELFGLKFEPLLLQHGKGTTFGFRFGPAAYLTDHSAIPPETLDRLRDLEVLFLDALRHTPHPTHSTVAQALEWVEMLKPKRTFLTHICHDLPHAATEQTLPPHVRLAHDEMRITVIG
jgi:phosphoribosyl 1,2-cyclic phosphate phosphodiesterase